MLKLFKIEWSKLLQSRSFKVLLIIYLTTYSLFLLSMSSLHSKLFKSDLFDALSEMVNYNPFAFPDIWIITTYLAQWFTVLVAIIVVSLVVNEFTFRTARQHIIDGLTRIEFVLGKFIMVVTMAIIVTILIFILGSFTGMVNKGGGVSSAGYGISLGYFFAFFIRTVGLLTFAMFMAMWIKRTGVTVLLFIVIHFGFIATIFRYRVGETLGDLLPMAAFNRLIRTVGATDEVIENYDKMALTDYIFIAPFSSFVVAFLYIGLFVGLSYVVIKNNDLK